MANNVLFHERLIPSISRALAAGVPLLSIALGEIELRLAYRTAGAEIDDPSCDEIFEAIDTGVYQRFEKFTDAASSYIYMRLCDLSDIPSALAPLFEAETIAHRTDAVLQVSLQLMAHQDAHARAGRPITSLALMEQRAASMSTTTTTDD